ncbi:MAG: helix-turn-helix domain-containing protein, partial [Synergistaceae bacterium]|nr:helix-turn-helix domain-containing protein [Synergistaceae bacterium]
MSFNSKLIQEIQQKSALSRKELSKMLRISDNQLYRIEKGLRQPSFSLLQRISALIGLPIDMLIERNIASLDDMEPEIGGYARENVTLKRDLERKREELLCAQKYIAELEREAEHSRAIINLQVRSGDIWCDDALTRGEKMKKLEILAIA